MIKPRTAPANVQSFLLGKDGASGALARETMVTLLTLIMPLIRDLKTLATVLAINADLAGSLVFPAYEIT